MTRVASPVSPGDPAPASRIYRTLWRWHFYAGLFCLPFLLTLSVTGAIYLFKPQIDAWSERSIKVAAVSEIARSMPYKQVQAALAAVPGASLVSYRLPRSPHEAVLITVQAPERRLQVYVDPFNLEILRQVAVEDRFINIVKTLHGELLLGNTGAVLVELAGCWAIVLIITGIYLWWPRRANGVAGVLFPRLFSGGRTFWRDLHAVTGIWIAALVLFLLISGLPWALVWGSVFDELRSRMGNTEIVDWTVSSGHEGHQMMSGAAAPATLTPALFTAAQRLDLAPPVELAPAAGETGIWKLASLHQNRTLRADVWLDETGQVIRSKDFSQRQALDRAIGIGISAHEGHLFGWFNQALGLLVTLGVSLVTISGCVMWYRRRPAGKLGAPPPGRQRPGWVIASIMLLLVMSLPLLAGSLILLLCLEWLVLRRLPLVRDWLGLGAS